MEDYKYWKKYRILDDELNRILETSTIPITIDDLKQIYPSFSGINKYIILELCPSINICHYNEMIN